MLNWYVYRITSDQDLVFCGQLRADTAIEAMETIIRRQHLESFAPFMIATQRVITLYSTVFGQSF